MPRGEPKPESGASYVVFAGGVRLAAGALADVAVAAKRTLDAGEPAPVLVFDADTGRVVDLDLRGGLAEVRERHLPPPPAPARRGRPKLGVVAREVTLLPRHWEWLAGQPGGASVALRRLVEAARKQEGEAGVRRARTEAAYRFMSALAGDFPEFEAAARALFASDRAELSRRTRDWPADVRDQLLRYLYGSEPATPHEATSTR